MNLRMIWGALLLLPFFAQAQQQITVEDFVKKGTFRTESVYSLNWMNDGGNYTALENNNIVQYDIATGNAVKTIVEGNSLSTPLEIDDYSFSADESQVLLLTNQRGIYRHSFVADYYVLDLGSKELRPLSEEGNEQYATFSPDGSKVAFVRANNLFYVDLDDMELHTITNDGVQNSIINGTTDWVYEEEFAFVKAFHWSPDSRKIAYQSFDESRVKEYNMQVWNVGLYPHDYRFKYPKAGEDNSLVSVTIFHLDGDKKVPVDIGTETDIYIPRVKWTRDASLLSVIRMNRLQNELFLLHANAASGKTSTVLHETSETYIDINDTDYLTYLSNGKEFIHASEMDGYKHLYLYTMDGKQARQLTSGNWEVSTFYGVDEKAGVIYYQSTENSPLERDVYSISLSGKKKTRLSTDAGVTRANFSADFSYYVKYFSSATQPLVVSLYKTRGNKQIKVLKDNANLRKAVAEYGVVAKEFYTFKTVDGTELNGYMLKPADFDPNKKYPVFMYQYSGPGSQQVMNSFGGGHFYFHQMLVQKGYIVSVIDGRGTGGRGEAFKKQTYADLGNLETVDQIESAKYLATLPYVDGSRIGIWGWSFGGYTSSLCMFKGADFFKAGIAVAPVTNWRFYDTIYTERYLKRPQDNASGYDDNSPVFYADGLKGKYLLIHGTGDDNVHFQNAVILQNALIQAGKKFDSFYYPDLAHSLYGGNGRMHLYTMMSDFVLNNL